MFTWIPACLPTSRGGTPPDPVTPKSEIVNHPQRSAPFRSERMTTEQKETPKPESPSQTYIKSLPASRIKADYFLSPPKVVTAGNPQRSAPASFAKSVQPEKDSPTILDRTWDTIVGSTKQGLGLFGTGISAMTEISQSNLLQDDEVQYEHRKKQYERMLSDNEKNPGTWDQRVLNAVEKDLQSTRRMLDVGKQSIAHSPLIRGANALWDHSTNLTRSGAQDIAHAKEGTDLFGSLLVDSVADMTQMAELAILNHLTMGLAALPVVYTQAFGAGVESARAKGTDLNQQAAYGLTSAIASVAGEKLLNVAAPFQKVFGSGILDEAVQELTEKLGSSATGRIVLSAIAEGGEELAQSIVLPVLQRAIYDPDAAFDLGNTMYQTTIGAITGTFGGGFDAITRSDPFLSGFLGDDLAEIQDGTTAENLLQYVQEYTENPELFTPKTDSGQSNPSNDSTLVSDLNDLNKLLEDGFGSSENSYPFEPEYAKSSLSDVLDSSKGLEDNIAMLQYYLSDTDYVLSTKISGPIGYSPDKDLIVYNSEDVLPFGTTMSEVLIHELAHRIDHLVYNTAENPNWKAAIEEVFQLAAPRRSEIENWFKPGGKYENDPFFCGAIGAIFKDTIDLPYSQEDEYWNIPGMQETELFANLCTMDILQSPGVQELNALLAPIYSVWLEILQGGLT